MECIRMYGTAISNCLIYRDLVLFQRPYIFDTSPKVATEPSRTIIYEVQPIINQGTQSINCRDQRWMRGKSLPDQVI